MDIEYEEEQMKFQVVGKLRLQYHRYNFLKRTLQLVVSVAFLSIFLSHSSGFSLFPHSFHVYFSTFLFSFFTRTLERKYMFLICNGILAFLAKTSVSSSSSSPSHSDLGPSSNFTQTKADEVQDTYRNIEVEGQGGPENGSLGSVQEEEEEEEEKEESESEVSVIVEDHNQEYKDGDQSEQVMEQEQKEESVRVAVAANEDGPSTEELNRKVEEFIRKMKEEIRIEAQQQLITV